MLTVPPEFFQSRRADMQPQGIHELIDWSYTARGGKQYDEVPLWT